VRLRWLDIGQGPFCVFMDRYAVEVHILARIELGYLERTSLVNKQFIIWLLGKLFLWDMVGSLEWGR